jgi:Fe-S cluster assembly iron-binding protein IscA
MLTLTTEAAQAINALLADQPGSGLRISEIVDGDQVRLGLAVAAEPAPNDQVIENQGSHVFVDDQVAPLLDDKTLDAQVNEDRQVAFTLVPGAPTG